MKAIIIGSGIAGLTAGCYLTRAGYEIVMYEQFTEIGGVTATIQQDGYAWDLGPLLLEGFDPTENAGKILKELGLYDKIELIRDDRGQSFEDFDLWKPEQYDGPYWRKESLKKQFPDEAKGLDRYYKFYDKMMSFFAVVDRATWAKGIKKWFLALRAILKAIPKVSKLKWGADRMMDYFFKDPRLQVVFTGILADFVVKPSEFIGLGVPRVNVETAFDIRIPLKIKGGLLPTYHNIKNGCGSMVNAMADYIRANGGQINTNTPVEEIVIQKGEAKGVKIKNDDYVASDIVLASGGARMIYFNLIGKQNLPLELIEQVENLVHMQSVLMVHIGIDFDPSKYQRKPLCYYYRTSDIEGNVRLMRKGHYHEGKEGFLIYIPSMYSPNMAPKGCHAVTVYTIAPDRLDEGNWKDRRKELADKLLIEAEKIIPGLRKRTKTRVILTPADFRKRINVDRHSFGGLAPVMGQNAPLCRTPINNLYHIGCQNQWGGGVTGSMMGARRAVKLILGKKKLNKIIKHS